MDTSERDALPIFAFARIDVGGGGPEIYKVSLPRILKLVECPVEGCPERAKNPGILVEHFMY